jgi:GMP synthase-like glutamine amidotransferase
MGGPMSVNDDLNWIPPALALIRSAVAGGVPVIGHCLGGQLMAKALGGQVTRNPVREIGWGEITAADNAAAREWLGERAGFLGFHWHGETFSLPPGATPLMASRHCANQGFVIGASLAMQCHVEMTEAMIRLWNRQWADEVNNHPGPSVQRPQQMYVDLETRLARLHEVADRLYGRWIAGLGR